MVNDRRCFLKGSALAAAGVLGSSAVLPRASAQTTSVSTTLVNAVNAAHVTAIANLYGGQVTSGADWMNISRACSSLSQNVVQVGFDASVKAAAAKVTVSQLSISTLDTTSVLQSIQAYQPTFAVSDLAQLIALEPTNSTAMSSALSKLQTEGLSLTLTQAAGTYSRICTQINDALNGSSLQLKTAEWRSKAFRNSRAMPALYQPSINHARFTRAVWQQIQQPPPSEGSGGSGYNYNCGEDGVLITYTGALFAILGLLAYGDFFEAEEDNDFVSGFTAFGGAGLTGWTLGHAAFCGF